MISLLWQHNKEWSNLLCHLNCPNTGSSSKVENSRRAEINGGTEQGTTQYNRAYMVVLCQQTILAHNEP
jgi:hypothetical protein